MIRFDQASPVCRRVGAPCPDLLALETCETDQVPATPPLHRAPGDHEKGHCYNEISYAQTADAHLRLSRSILLRRIVVIGLTLALPACADFKKDFLCRPDGHCVDAIPFHTPTQ